MTPLIAAHAVGAALALLLGPVNILRRSKGDRPHRLIGRVWVASMYWTVLSSFFVRELDPGHLSWLHGLSAFTFVTVSIGLWAAMTGRIKMHRSFMRGSYLGLLVAFIFAAAVTDRDIPQLAIHRPVLLTACAVAIVALAGGIVILARHRNPASGADAATGDSRSRTVGTHG